MTQSRFGGRHHTGAALSYPHYSSVRQTDPAWYAHCRYHTFRHDDVLKTNSGRVNGLRVQYA
jgi:hypothetical protein